MKKSLFSILFLFVSFNPIFGQRITLYGKMSGDDFKLVERTIADLFSQTSLIKLPLYHENTLLTKIDRNRLPRFDAIAGYYNFNEVFTQSLNCNGVKRIVSLYDNNATKNRVSMPFVVNQCDDYNSDYNSFINSAVSALNSVGSKPFLDIFFTTLKPIISITTKINSNTTLVDKTIMGRLKSSNGGTLFVVEDGKITSKIPVTEDWQTNLRLDNFIRNLKIFAVNSKGDTSDIVTYSNISFKALNESSLVMLHPGGSIKPNGPSSDVVLKCNTQTMNGFYNFQFLVDKDLLVDSIVINFDDLNGGRVIQRRYMYNIDETLKRVTDRGDGFKKVCVYLLYSQMNFKSPCEIDDSYLYYLVYKLPNGQKIQTSKKQVFFESFRENYDEFPCNCN